MGVKSIMVAFTCLSDWKGCMFLRSYLKLYLCTLLLIDMIILDLIRHLDDNLKK